MTTSFLKANPTRYKDIVFKSKSEACFARALDLIQSVGCWAYEPLKFWHLGRSQDGKQTYTPDFVILERPPLFTCVIEYKPKMVTQEYMNYLSREFDDHEENGFGRANSYFLFCGSPFNSEGFYKAFLWVPERLATYECVGDWGTVKMQGWIEATGAPLFENIWYALAEAKSFRFDLA